jgi:serine O-acetyltransferase
MNMFARLVEINCFSKNKTLRGVAGNLLEKLYGCEINCTEIDKSALFAHHARGCTIIADNVIVADGAKILGPVIIGENSVVAAGSIITKDIPANSVAYGVNQYKPKDENYDLIFNANMIRPEKIIEANKKLIGKFVGLKE